MRAARSRRVVGEMQVEAEPPPVRSSARSLTAIHK
jgi:hypothetical protein